MLFDLETRLGRLRSAAEESRLHSYTLNLILTLSLTLTLKSTLEAKRASREPVRLVVRREDLVESAYKAFKKLDREV